MKAKNLQGCACVVQEQCERRLINWLDDSMPDVTVEPLTTEAEDMRDEMTDSVGNQNDIICKGNPQSPYRYNIALTEEFSIVCYLIQRD